MKLEKQGDGEPIICVLTPKERKLTEFSLGIETPVDPLAPPRPRSESGRYKDRILARGLIFFADWNVKFYNWQRVGPGKPPADWQEVVAGEVLEERKQSEINFTWGGRAPSEKVPAAHFAAVCSTELDLPAGKYVVRTVSDDGIRVTIDGKLTIDNWTWHGPTEDKAEVDLAAGKHKIRVDYFQIDGASQLQFWIEPLK